MDDLVGVDEEQSLTNLRQYLLDLGEAELAVDVAQEAGQVMLTKHEVECAWSCVWGQISNKLTMLS